MKNTVLWVVGEPGVGKTTLVRQLLPLNPKLLVKPKWTVGAGVVAAGHYTGNAFDGGDTVPYNGAAEALEYWREVLMKEARLTILDGDRFSNANTKSFFAGLGVSLRCAWLHGEPSLVADRRTRRGSNQNLSWVKGRATKARRFSDSFTSHGLAVSIDASLPLLEQVALLKSLVA